MSAIRRYLSINAKSNADTRAQIEEMAAEVRDALAELASEIGRCPGSRSPAGSLWQLTVGTAPATTARTTTDL